MCARSNVCAYTRWCAPCVFAFESLCVCVRENVCALAWLREDAQSSALTLTRNTTCLTAVDCRSPPVVNNAIRTVPVSHEYGTRITYTCRSGYWFGRGVHNKTITCTRYGIWSEEPGHCTRTYWSFALSSALIQIPCSRLTG